MGICVVSVACVVLVDKTLDSLIFNGNARRQRKDGLALLALPVWRQFLANIQLADERKPSVSSSLSATSGFYLRGFSSVPPSNQLRAKPLLRWHRL